jgi:hypothetical protein
MRKIETVFERDPVDRRYVIDVVTPGCEWVAAGLGVATRKWNGVCCRFHEGAWWTRRQVGPVEGTVPWPMGFISLETDPVTRKTVGWEPAENSGFYRYLREAYGYGFGDLTRADEGTYELCGPKINGNPEHLPGHQLIRHGVNEWPCPIRSFAALGELFRAVPELEGLVFYRTPQDPNSGMGKIKARDFRLPAPKALVLEPGRGMG